MRLQSPNLTHMSTALRGAATDGSRDGATGVPGRHEDRNLTSATVPRVCNEASGQRHDVRPAGARKPAPSTSAGSRRPDTPTGLPAPASPFSSTHTGRHAREVTP